MAGSAHERTDERLRIISDDLWSRVKASPETIERRVQLMKRQLAEGGDVARSVLRELFPHAIFLQPDDSANNSFCRLEPGLGGSAAIEEAVNVRLE